MLLTSGPTVFLRFPRLSAPLNFLTRLPSINSTRPGRMEGFRAKMSGLTPYAKKHKVTVIGSGNWLDPRIIQFSSSTDTAPGVLP